MPSRGNSSGAGSVSRSVSRESTPTTRRAVMDLDVDDDDDDWEDEGTLLQGLGTTTHCSRHPHKTVIARKRRTHVVGAKRTADDEVARANALATAKKCCETRVHNLQGLAEDLDDWQAQSEERAQELSEKYGMKVKEVRRCLHASSAFKPRRKVSLYNAKISALVSRLNKGRDVGHRYTMPDIKRMVSTDPSILEGFSKEEKKMVADVWAKRDKKHRGARANNLAASADAKRTVERLIEEITSLAERSGMIGFAMFTRGHIHNSSIPVTLESWGALGFFREVLKRDPADIAALFELWAKECTELIKAGLRTITGQMKIAMNYDNYIKAIVEAKNVGLLGWPHGVYFKRMSLQSAIGPLRTLRDALKAGTCKWVILSARQKKQLLADFKEMVANGEATEKVAKPRGKGKKEEAGEVRKSTRTGKKGAAQPPSNSEEEEGATEEGEDAREDASEDEQRARRIQRGRPLKVSAWEEQHRKLLALVAHKKAGAGKGGERGHERSGSTKTASGKRKCPADVNDAPATKKKRTSRGEHRRCTDEDDDLPPAKRAKTSKLTTTSASKPSTTSGASGVPRPKPKPSKLTTTSASKPSTTSEASGVPRPKPKPRYKGALADAASTSRTTGGSGSPSPSAAPSRTGSPLRATAAPAHTASTEPAAARSAPASGMASSRAASPPRSTSPSPRRSATSSRGRANTVRGKRGGPPGRREMP
ncbi:hypothetical protein B0H14DRAFT_3514731 [Mycena olivaceomarginata]|nr:hypothetical protein B0H14DRAFT_3514731 [Mycena olivaceomarginata]